jgi:hypothetical protein
LGTTTGKQPDVPGHFRRLECDKIDHNIIVVSPKMLFNALGIIDITLNKLRLSKVGGGPVPPGQDIKLIVPFQGLPGTGGGNISGTSDKQDFHLDRFVLFNDL